MVDKLKDYIHLDRLYFDYFGIDKINNFNLLLANQAWFNVAQHINLHYCPDIIYPNPFGRDEKCNFSKIDEIDERAKSRTSEKYLCRTRKEIVTELTDCYERDYEKARILFVWLTSIQEDSIDHRNSQIYEVKSDFRRIYNNDSEKYKFLKNEQREENNNITENFNKSEYYKILCK